MKLCPPETLLAARAAGHLTSGASVRIDRHAARCIGCQEKLEMFARLNDVASSMTSVAPTKSADTLWHAVVNSRIPAPRRARSWRPALGVGMAAAVGFAVFALLPGTPVHPAPAFAEVEQSMAKAHRVTWTERIEWSAGKRNGQPRHDMLIYDLALDLDRGMMHSAVRPAGPEEADVITESDSYMDGQHIVLFDRATRRYIRTAVSPSGFPDARTPRERLRQFAFFSRTTADSQTMLDINGPNRTNLRVQTTAWESSTVSLNNRRCLLYVRDRTVIYPESTAVGTWHYRESFWVEPDSLRLIRRERALLDISGRQIKNDRSVCENFRFDVPIPAANVRVPTPPVGVTYQYVDQSPRAGAPSAETRTAAQKTVESLIDARSRKDASAALALFDADAAIAAAIERNPVIQRNVEIRSRWQVNLRKGLTIRTQRWAEAGGPTTGQIVAIAHPYARTYQRKHASDPFPPGPDANALDVIWKDSDKMWRFELRYTSGQWKAIEITKFAGSPTRIVP